MRWLIISLLIIPLATAKVLMTYPPSFEETIDPRERLLDPHIYPGQTIISSERFLEDPMRPGTSTVRWTKLASYSINLDRIHLLRGSYTFIIKSRYGPEIRQLQFETTKIYLKPNYYKIRYDKETQTIWLAKYAD